MMRSANEIAGMVLKAARGAGWPLGCAEEIARAAPFMAEANALDMLPDLLGAAADMPEFKGARLCGGHPVMAMISYLDLSGAGMDVAMDTDVDVSVTDAMIAARGAKASPVGPFAVDEALWQVLAEYAAKTFVPETEASRLAGAGAGLTDND